MTVPSERAGSATTSVDAVAQRLVDAALGTTELLAVYVGDRLGWYQSLADGGPATARELAERTGTHPRYAREWLEHQAVAGIVEVQPDPGVPAQRGEDEGARRRFELPPAAAEVLTDRNSLAYLAPLGRMLAAVAPHLPRLLEAYRTGGGVSWAELGADARESQADMNRPWYEQRLPAALASVPDLHGRLSRATARAVDIGCGAGWSSIAIARAYPGATVDGYEIDGPSVEMARANAAAAGLADRVRFHHADAEELSARDVDVAFAFECLHDMPHPVDVLSAARRSLRDDGVMVVMDEAVAEAFTPHGDEVERLMYGFSLFVCLPDGMAHAGSAGTGTVMRPATLDRYAREAGFSGTEVLPVHDFGFWRFYRLTP